MNNTSYISKISLELSLSVHQIQATVALLDAGGTIPFISRYRKEATGSLDEVVITTIRDRIQQLRELDKRREAVLESIDKQGKLSDELKEKILSAQTMAVLEDLYLPFKPKRRTRATVAKEKDLEPLARILWAQGDIDPIKEAGAYVSSEKKVKSIEEALAGARDIMAEWINEDALARARIRHLFFTRGMIRSKVIKGKKQQALKFKDYYDWSEAVSSIPSHRMLAMRRGEKEGFLSLRVTPPEDEALRILKGIFVKSSNAASLQVQMALEDCYKRLLSLSMETEVRVETKKRADVKAIKVFAQNLRQLLMAAPLGQRNVLAIDPGFRTGCKVVCLNRQGKLIAHDTIFPSFSGKQVSDAGEKIRRFCEEYDIEFIAIGNGTASREAEHFIRGLGLREKIQVVMVSENGASIYSASQVAREEFPGYDVTVRGAVSIGRRLMDPLAELVKIDPKSIGVGQYQHDVDQILLKQSLDDVVISCVNQVGVEVNTASKELLMYVSGVGPVLAKEVVDYRNKNGPFQSRVELMNVNRFGAKVFEQAAGFLRISGGENPLDASAVHPESYGIVERMAADLGCSIKDLMRQEQLGGGIDLHRYVTSTVGLPTLVDIKNELMKPGRDPRQRFELFQFDESVHSVDDLTPGMVLPGVVTNITAFGVFVDIGVHLDGLVHVSQMADRFIKDPNDIVKVHQKVRVTVVDIDKERKRISLSMKQGRGKTRGHNKTAFSKKQNLRKQASGEQKPGFAKKTNVFLNNPFKNIKLK